MCPRVINSCVNVLHNSAHPSVARVSHDKLLFMRWQVLDNPPTELSIFPV